MNETTDEWDTPAFEHGVEVGEAIENHRVSEEIRNIFEKYGKSGIIAWLEYQNPKSTEEWAKYPKSLKKFMKQKDMPL